MSLVTAPDNAPFFLPGDRRGVLLVHGFTGTPFEMRLAGDALARRGYTIASPLLAGHGTGLAELSVTRWPDWLASAEHAFDELRQRCDQVAVCGLSLGGLLSLELARRHPQQIVAIASLSAPLWLARWQTVGLRLLAHLPLLKALPKFGGSDIVDVEMRQRNPTGRGFPLGAVSSLLDCMDHVRTHLHEIDRPAFVAHGRRDHTAPFACMAKLTSELRGPVDSLVLERSAHVITLDVERAELFRRLGEFLERHLN